MEEGWVMLHRKVRKHWIFNKRRVFSEFEAWIDLIMSANHSDSRFQLGMDVVEIRRGGMVTSLRGLGERWMWSRTKVRNFLNLLQRDGMITYFSDTQKTVLDIVNYSVYQSTDYEKNDTIVPRECRENDTRVTRKDTNNNDKNEKNVKNEKKKYAEFVVMTNAEYEKLTGTYGEDRVQRMIEVLDNYKGSSGKRYKSDYRAILNWVADRVLNEKSNIITMPNAGAYRDDSQKCPFCKDSGWVLDENRKMVRCSCQEVRANG